MEQYNIFKKVVFGIIFIGLCSFSSIGQTPWINEIHYDNSGIDANEGVEIAIPSGSSCTTVSVVLYNGSTGATYGTATASDDVVTDADCSPTTSDGVTFYWLDLAVLQNDVDGMALLCDGVVIQFLSYEGIFTATNGPANGMTSTDIGVFETSGTTTQSLQLQGTGSQYSDFSWNYNVAYTHCSENIGQTISSTPITPTQLTVTSSPACADNGVVLSVTVCATDASENVDNTYTDNISISIATEPGGATLGGTLTQTAIAGCATFSDITLDVNGDYTLNSTDGALIDGVSGTISITTDCNSCFEIDAILVDACNANSGTEGENEMVNFHTNTSFNTSTIDITWPNNSFLGVCQDATSAQIVSDINSTITGGGTVYEPPGGLIPYGAEVILVTSTDFDPLNHDWSQLNYDVYMIFQCAGNTGGHFANANLTPGIRELSIDIGTCADTVEYDRTLLPGPPGIDADGDAVEFTADGTATYGNNGCAPPLFPLPIENIVLNSKTNENTINLTWKVFGENELGNFYIQKSSDNKKFKTIETIKSKELFNEYIYTDSDNSTDNLYYRIQFVNENINLFSNIISVRRDNKPFYLLFPNPIKDQLLINISNSIDENATFILYNTLGEKIVEKHLLFENKKISTKIDLGSIKQGSYIVSIVSNSEIHYQKVILKRD